MRAPRCASTSAKPSAMAKSHPRMALRMVGDARSAAAARERAGAVCCTACCATPACGAAFCRASQPGRQARSTRCPTDRRRHRSKRFAEQLAAKIDAIRAATGAAKVMLVAHSMGGLVARAYLRRYGAAHVRCLVTIGTPHHGSVHAWLVPGVCLAQMRPGNAWLAELNRNEARGTAGAHRVALVMARLDGRAADERVARRRRERRRRRRRAQRAARRSGGARAGDARRSTRAAREARARRPEARNDPDAGEHFRPLRRMTIPCRPRRQDEIERAPVSRDASLTVVSTCAGGGRCDRGLNSLEGRAGAELQKRHRRPVRPQMTAAQAGAIQDRSIRLQRRNGRR